MMLSSLVMMIVATTLYNVFNEANSAGLPSSMSTQVLKGDTDENRKYFEFSNNIEHKLESLMQTVSRMDNSIQNLQEKSHTWAIFQHHIESWNDGLRILENKLDILKRTHDEEQQHMLNKLELALGNTKDNSIMDEIRETLNKDRDIQIASSSKVNTILRHLQTMQKEKTGGSSSDARKNANVMIPSSCNATNKIERGLHAIVHQMAQQKDLKQLQSLEKRSAKNLEGLTQSISQALDKQEEITTRLQRSNECCYSLSSELTTFTESSDILLKRIEKLINNVSEKLNQIDEKNDEFEDTKETDEDNYEDITNVHADIFHDDIDRNESKEEMDEENVVTEDGSAIHEPQTELYENIQEVEFLRPGLSGCHELDTDTSDEDDGSTRIDGIYKFLIPQINEHERDFNERHCVFPANNTGLPWTVIQQRGPFGQQENFNRSWSDYRNGFGHLYRDFWFGNEFIHRLVFQDDYELRIELEDFNGTKVWAEYSTFRIDTEHYNYNLLIGDYRGTAADAMKYHNDNDFSTYDRRNDRTVDACCSCSLAYASGWWFDNCSEANLNGIYHYTAFGWNYNGIMWELWQGDYSLKRTRMMIRPRNIPTESTISINSSNDDGEHNEDP